MKKYLEQMKLIGLFDGIGAPELETLLKCLGSEVRRLGRGEIILRAGETPRFVGIVLSGVLHVVREGFDGNRSLLTSVSEGESFAEALCCAGVAESPVTVMADTETTVLLLRFSKITCPNSCAFHTRLIGNMLGLIAGKTIMLQNRMEIVCLKSVRAKILRYLESFAHTHGRQIIIPFDREEMADYLCVERTALSHELSRMKKDGLLEYKKNRFILKKAL